MRAGRISTPAVLVVVGAVLAGSGLVMTTVAPRAAAPDIVPPQAVDASATDTTTTTAPLSSGTVQPSAPPVVAAPVAMSLPGAADVPVVPVGVLPSGAMQLPDRPTVLGWYASGATPGDGAGTAVVAGHVDSARFGPGPLVRLLDLSAGGVLRVVDATGAAHRFSVVSRASYPKSALPAGIFRRDGPPRLAVVTCGGAFDRARGHYADNVVVLALPM